MDELIDLGLRGHKYRRENHTGAEEAHYNGHLTVLRQACKRRCLGLRYTCLNLRFAFPGPLSQENELEQHGNVDFELRFESGQFELGHTQPSLQLLKRLKAYEETAAALNVPQPGIFSHAEQLLNGEAAAC